MGRPMRLKGFAIHNLNNAGAPDGIARWLQRALRRSAACPAKATGSNPDRCDR
jgi:hypothetical protein